MRTLRFTPVAAVALALTVSGCSGAAETSANSPVESSSSSTGENAQQETATPSETPGFTPSGDFATDVEAVGITPENMDSYEDFMVEGMCDSDLEPIAGESAFERQVRTTGDTSPESGEHPDVLRAAVAYDCPNREDLLEDALQKARDGGFIS